ncbi:phosphonate ABC transporter, permease protein PhnE [Rhizobium rhizosphaerae]|uniref:Phosphonate ABC transporter, permease protein PhnE n=1 Tax=Xaviernesmea rhizosphaerae TaxID=1672749 RepID=A0A1Q9APT7_9HYPH|nr:phosphonate ABC transporter, permease protein PhnE [Xaviernesmea rhizosphaerae]OLP57442.1 phosphonate ABC transporter, permease protein PhnE [Xaviernesmea rhizosphaerae]OQP84105.1 phosphonate ABC transporter, permease protein PhnE [Xaviernesmea rhizosphaerae]
MTSSRAHHISPAVHSVHTEWSRMIFTRRLYTIIGLLILAYAFVASVQFADESNAGHFFDRLPHLFDFTSWLMPREWSDVWRALFDLPSVHDTGSEEYNFDVGRVYVFGSFYIPEYFQLMFVTLNVAMVATLISFFVAVPLSLLAAQNLSPSRPACFLARRTLEFLRAFPTIVIAGLFAAVLSIGPVSAIIAVSLHAIGALGKQFYEVAENIDMKAHEGVGAVGANWFERMRFAVLPQVLPNYLSYGLLRFEINVRSSTILGAVGAGGIGEELKLAISRGFGAKTLAMMLLLFLTVVAVDQFSAWLRRRLVGDDLILQHV